MRKFILSVCVLVLTFGLPGLASANHKPFEAGSLKQIEQQYAGKSFLLVMWELNCFPCHEEMELIAGFKKEHPEADVVMISTDDFSKLNDINAMLEKHKLQGVDSWVFADQNMEKLRYSIDPEWFGELPRNYIYDTDGSRIGFSGKLTKEVLEEWIK
jgi:thiol-disulfide isomerase/thioredoxin